MFSNLWVQIEYSLFLYTHMYSWSMTMEFTHGILTRWKQNEEKWNDNRLLSFFLHSLLLFFVPLFVSTFYFYFCFLFLFLSFFFLFFLFAFSFCLLFLSFFSSLLAFVFLLFEPKGSCVRTTFLTQSTTELLNDSATNTESKVFIYACCNHFLRWPLSFEKKVVWCSVAQPCTGEIPVVI